MNEDYYEILQVHEKAEIEVIEVAYKRLARKYHPDVNKSPGSEERMKAINIAYETLKTPTTREEYDLKRLAERASKAKSQHKAKTEENSEYHYQSQESIRFERANPAPDNRSYETVSEQPLKPLIRFCEGVNSHLEPINGFIDVFPYNAREIVCHIVWPDSLPPGTEVKVVWYQDGESAFRHHFEMEDCCDILVAGLTLSGLFVSIAGSRWEVFVTKDGSGVGKGRFRVLSKHEANVRDGILERFLSGDRPKSLLDRFIEMLKGER